MKKSLIALAVLAAAGAASAQSSVTMFGIVDATVQFGRGDVSDKTQLGHSGYSTSRLGFRGTEDLGGGLAASFWLEAAIDNDTGNGTGTNTNNQASGAAPALGGGQGLTFHRRSTVSLSGGFGEVRLGRDYNPAFWNLSVFDPFGSNGVGATQTYRSIITGVTAVRTSNGIGYFLPGNLGGFYGQAQYYMGENNQNGAATEDDGTGYGLRVGFATGPVNVAFGASKTKYASGDAKQMNLGGHFDFGIGKVMAQYSKDELGALDGKGWLLGGLFPVGAGEIRASYSVYETDAIGDPETKKLAIGYVHNLSKRTAVYTTVARVKNDGGASHGLNGAQASVNGNSTGLDVGIRHSF